GQAKSETLSFNPIIGETVYLECGVKDPEVNSIGNIKDVINTVKSLKDAVYLREVESISEPASTEKTRKRIHTSLTNIRSKVCIVVCIVGFFGFINGFFTAWEKAFWVSSKTELPLGDIGGIAADSDGNIYVLANFYDRVQKYSPEGKFLTGWSSRDKDAEVRVEKQNSCRDTEGNVYKVHNKWWRPKIIKTSPDGAKTTVINTPWRLWVILGPFPAFIFFAVGLIGLGGSHKPGSFIRKDEK
ncbi:MAG: hypothetical protein JW976_08565, partial [Syntrophaceae bacterium]|nr:hypothetical protein [Syntrophaceae bacterium]